MTKRERRDLTSTRRTWREDTEVLLGIQRLLDLLGDDSYREGLKRTPERVVRAFLEMTRGYEEDVAAILSTTFAEQCDEMVVLRDVEFWSTCEHHLLPFHGTATVGYLPGSLGRVVGLSKLARAVHAYALRLQVQERLTREIADAVLEHLKAQGVGVVLAATHLCMACRGVKTPGTMVTSSLLGKFRSDPMVRAEFLALARSGS